MKPCSRALPSVHRSTTRGGRKKKETGINESECPISVLRANYIRDNGRVLRASSKQASEQPNHLQPPRGFLLAIRRRPRKSDTERHLINSRERVSTRASIVSRYDAEVYTTPSKKNKRELNARALERAEIARLMRPPFIRRSDIPLQKGKEKIHKRRRENTEQSPQVQRCVTSEKCCGNKNGRQPIQSPTK